MFLRRAGKDCLSCLSFPRVTDRLLARAEGTTINSVSSPRFAAKVFVLFFVMVPPASARSWPESKTATTYAEGARLPYLPRGGTRVERSTCEGSTTVLEVVRTVAKIPQHDVALGRTRLILRAKAASPSTSRDATVPAGEVLLVETLTEVWECLAYNRRTRRYVITSVNEHGVKQSMRGLVYIDETAATFEESVFGRRGLHAVSSVYQPASGFLALIATVEDEGEDGAFELYVLDTDTDRLKALGEPPAPPPLERALRKDRQAIMMMWPWEAPESHYTPLDAAIWGFADATTLRVSYGRDTAKARAKRRKEQRWDLQRLFRGTP